MTSPAGHSRPNLPPARRVRSKERAAAIAVEVTRVPEKTSPRRNVLMKMIFMSAREDGCHQIVRSKRILKLDQRLEPETTKTNTSEPRILPQKSRFSGSRIMAKGLSSVSPRVCRSDIEHPKETVKRPRAVRAARESEIYKTRDWP